MVAVEQFMELRDRFDDVVVVILGGAGFGAGEAAAVHATEVAVRDL
ncbi:hypothetical protein [Kribbella sp. NBC_00889]|nr:hypothetical protein OG817_22335 [Kribbella sp. NBC_00889]